MVAQERFPFCNAVDGAEARPAYRQARGTRSVREWPLSEQPREKLRHFGPARLSNAELLSIVLREGSAGEDAVSLATRLLVEHDGLPGLARTAGTGWPGSTGSGRPRPPPWPPRWSWAAARCSIRGWSGCRYAPRTTSPRC